MNEKNVFQQLLQECSKITGFTGAGVSTESGIADYRSQGGIWQRFQPVYLDEFIADADKRRLYWQRKAEMWPSLSKATPGPAHRFFTGLYKRGKLNGLITQNIDGLHERSGLPDEFIVNLHGTSLEIACLDCGDIFAAQGFMETLDLNRESPLCRECGGLLKPNTVSFGQNLRAGDLLKAEQLAQSCDLLIAAGSTLLVQPAASYPLLAKEHGAKLIIITLSETPLDSKADLVINAPLGQFLKEVRLS